MLLGCFPLLLTEADKFKLLQLEYETTVGLRVRPYLGYCFYCLLYIHPMGLDHVGCKKCGAGAGILVANEVKRVTYPWSKTF